MKRRIRELINRDDGKYYQIGNHDLNHKEVIGYIFLVLSMLIYLFVNKGGFQHEWLGWLFLGTGILSLGAGVWEN